MTDTRDLIYKLLEVAECYSDGRETYEPFEQIIREARSYLNNEELAMTKHNPITPPPELVQTLWDQFNSEGGPEAWDKAIAAAAKWGADAELEACCEWLEDWVGNDSYAVPMRAARRPKPPSLKQQALAALDHALEYDVSSIDDETVYDTIRCALEALPDD